MDYLVFFVKAPAFQDRIMINYTEMEHSFVPQFKTVHLSCTSVHLFLLTVKLHKESHSQYNLQSKLYLFSNLGLKLFY